MSQTNIFSRKPVLLFSTEQLFFSVKAALSKTLQIAGKNRPQKTFFTEQDPVATCCVIHNLNGVQPIQCVHLSFPANTFRRSMICIIIVNDVKSNFRKKIINPLLD